MELALGLIDVIIAVASQAHTASLCKYANTVCEHS